jgi:hypothetical protein
LLLVNMRLKQKRTPPPSVVSITMFCKLICVTSFSHHNL